MTAPAIVVSPEPRNPSAPPRRSRFIARLGADGRVLGAFSAPFLGAARLLLAEGVQPETWLRTRHAGSEVVALRSTVGAAARLHVREETNDGKPRFTRWAPFDQSSREAAA
jgi:hypothetical protein